MKNKEEPHNTFLTPEEEKKRLRENKLRTFGLYSEGYSYQYTEKDEIKAIKYINENRELPKALQKRLLNSIDARRQQHREGWEEKMKQPHKEGELYFD